MTTAVGKWPASARLVAGRCGGPLIHSSYTTTGDTTRGRMRSNDVSYPAREFLLPAEQPKSDP